MKFTSPVFSAVSGSIGGTTFAHNRGGMYTRARAVPTNPNSIRQQNVRSAFNAAIEAWSASLSPAQRAAWNNYAANVPVTNKLGQTVNLSGQNMFVRNYAFAMQPEVNGVLLAAPTKDAPVVFNTGVAPILFETSEAQDNAIGLNNGATALDTTIHFSGATDDAVYTVLYLGVKQNPGRNFYKGPYRLFAVVAGISASIGATFDQTNDGGSTGYPPLADGDLVPVRVRNYFADGRLSQTYEAILPVVEAAP